MSATPWFSAPTGTRPVLWCFPYAGGGRNIFRGWDSVLAPWVEVRPVILPGRDMRFGEPCPESIDELARCFIDATVQAGVDHLPQAFLGHSMGAAIAYEAAALAEARANQSASTSLLIVGGRAAPSLPRDNEPLHMLPNAAFRHKLGEMGGTPRAVLDNEDLMELLLPVIRSDFKAIETWVSRCPALRRTAVMAIGAALDKESQFARLLDWQHVSLAGTTVHEIPAAGHFCIHSHREDYLEQVIQAVVRWQGA
jgi:medium-chain acyl-[acyl-carrier-protein] hydrolase